MYSKQTYPKFKIKIENKKKKLQSTGFFYKIRHSPNYYYYYLFFNFIKIQ